MKRIPWEDLDMECVGEAANGLEACEQISILAPDIVITDIKMPQADGFYTIREAQNKHPGIQFIVISGYDDFTYLKQSVQLQVVNYILKPIDTEELIETLRQASKRIQKYHATTELEQKAANYKTLYDQEKLGSSFRSFLLSSLDFQVFSQQLSQLSYPLLQASCFCVLLNMPESASLTSPQQSKLESRVEQLCFPSNCVVLNLYHGTSAVIVCRNGEQPPSAYFLQQCRTAVLEITGCSSNFYLSCSSSVPTRKMRKAYQEALTQMIRRFLPVERGTTLFLPENCPSFLENSSCQSDWEVAFGLQLFDECKNLLHDALAQSARSFGAFFQTISKLLDLINHYSSQNTAHSLFAQPFRELYLLQFSSLEALEKYIYSVLDQFSTTTEEMDIGDKIIQYLRGNFTKPLALQKLSDLFHLNQIYLGQLIKKKTGMSFNKFLNSLRMEYAAQCIRQDPEISFKDLAFSIGFTDSHYFTKVFKQYYHVPPSEYRLQVLQQEYSHFP